MRKNAISKRRLHSSMKSNSVGRASGAKRTILLVLCLAALAAAGVGLYLCYAHLRDLCREQSVIVDRERQVVVHTGGRNIKTGLVLELFGITNGNNLATIDFKGKRAEILRDYPAIRDLAVRRMPPDRVEITVQEREPIARLSYKGNTFIRRVVDAEGVVFERSANKSTLPIIIESKDDTTPPGQRFSGRRLAALRLIEYCQNSGFSPIGILDIDVTGADNLVATLGNYDSAIICWEGMDGQLPGSDQAMARQMLHLQQAIRTRVAESSSSLAVRHLVWNATEPDRCFADLKEPIQ